MSYDVSIGPETFNITYNVGLLFREHLPCEGGLYSLHGKTGREAAREILAFWDSFNRECDKSWRRGVPGLPAISKKYDPLNGWGNLIGALTFIGMLQAACAMHPRCKVRVS